MLHRAKRRALEDVTSCINCSLVQSLFLLQFLLLVPYFPSFTIYPKGTSWRSHQHKDAQSNSSYCPSITVLVFFSLSSFCTSMKPMGRPKPCAPLVPLPHRPWTTQRRPRPGQLRRSRIRPPEKWENMPVIPHLYTVIHCNTLYTCLSTTSMRQNQKNNFSNLHYVNVCHISAPIISIFICADCINIINQCVQDRSSSQPNDGSDSTCCRNMADSIAASAVRLSTSDHVSLSSTLIFLSRLSRLSRLNPNGPSRGSSYHIISYMIIYDHIFTSYIFIYLHALVISSGSGWYWRNLKSSFFGMKLMKRNKMNKPCTCGIQFDPRLSRRGRFSLVTCRFNEFQREKELRWSMVEHGGAVKAARCAFWFRSFNSCSSFCTLLWSARIKVSS